MDLLRIEKSQRRQLVVSGDGAFYTLLGEGATIGMPGVFLRLHHCNLNCTWCDSAYTWDRRLPEFQSERQVWTIPDTVSRILAQAAGRCRRLVITGGEPLLQQRQLVHLLDELPDWMVEFETNGTIVPCPRFHFCQINCSPKLANSGIPLNRRFNRAALEAINGLRRSWFKFVVRSAADITEMEKTYGHYIDKEKIILSPEGTDMETILAVQRVIAPSALEKGYRLTPRLHIELWGNERKK